MRGIIPINDLTNMVAIMDLNDDDKNTIIQQLNRYASVCSDALEAIGSNNEAILEAVQHENQEDDEDEKLTDCENDAWIGLSAINGYTEDPRPDWYIAMWGD